MSKEDFDLSFMESDWYKKRTEGLNIEHLESVAQKQAEKEGVTSKEDIYDHFEASGDNWTCQECWGLVASDKRIKHFSWHLGLHMVIEHLATTPSFFGNGLFGL